MDFGAFYIWICGHCGKIPTQDHLRRMVRAVRLLGEVPEAGMIGEAGVHSGVSGMILSSMGHAEYHGFDSFEGLKPTEEDDPEQARLGAYQTGAERVIRQFAESGLNRCHIHVGEIPGIFKDQPQREYKFVHVDVDCHAPSLTSFEWFWPQVVPGGIMLCDDFLWKGCRLACEQFGVPYEVTAENQAFWRKPGNN